MKERIDALGADRPERLRVFTGRTLDVREDAELQAIVEEAAGMSGAAVCLITLILRRTQLFRAAYGLNGVFEGLGATDRDVSICQFVVRDRKVLEIEDASLDPGLPQQLVRRAGIRSYLGAPVQIGGEVVGSLCLMDGHARRYPAHVRQRLEALAKRASARLAELASETLDKEVVLQQFAAGPTFLELRNALNPLSGFLEIAAVAAADLRPLVKFARSQEEELVRGSAEALDDLTESLARLEGIVAGLSRGILAIEKVVRGRGTTLTLAQVTDAADGLAHHVTKLVGGIRWTGEIPRVELSGDTGPVVSTVAAAQTILAERLAGDAARGGLVGSVSVGKTEAAIRVGLAAGADPAGLEHCAVALRSMLGILSPVSCSVERDGLVIHVPLATPT